MRDITLEDTFYHDFTTRAFATGVPTVLAGSPVLSVLEENNATPITAGVSVSVDRASVVGLNEATIVATAANGYANGSSYSIYISTGTVGGVSVVGEVIGQFTVGSSAAAVDLANVTDGLGAIKTETAAILVDTGEIGAAGAGLTNINLPNQTMDITGDITGNLSGSVGSVTGHTNQTGDTYALANGATGFVAIDTVVDAILVDTGEIGTAGAGLSDITINAASVDLIWDEDVDTSHQTAGTAGKKLDDAGGAADPWATALPGAYGAGTAGKIIGDNIDAPISTVDTVVDSILADTAEIGTAGAGLTDLGGMSTGMKAEVNTEADTALTDYDPPTNAEMEARTPTAAQLAYITDHAATAPPVTFTGGTTTTAVLGNVDGSAASSVDDFYNGRILIFNAGTLDEQATDITDYDGGTTTATITATTTAVTSGHTAILV